jgi:tRNA-modifying protein YgfZ
MDLEIYRWILAGGSAIFSLSPRAIWRLTGPDGERYLNGQVTNDMTRLADGAACYAAVCTAKGRMEGDVSIARHAGDFYLDAVPELRESLGARLDKYLIADDAAFEELSDTWHLAHVFGATPPALPADGFVISHARYGVPGHDVWSASPISPSVTEADVVETLRLEHGIPRWGAELGVNTLPPEAGPHMLAAISYTKGCYVGQETIARLKSVGHVNRTLVFMKADSEIFPPAGAKLLHEGREVGTVTSSGFSPRLGKSIALGYVQRQFSTEATLLQAGGFNLTVAAPLSFGAKL